MVEVSAIGKQASNERQNMDFHRRTMTNLAVANDTQEVIIVAKDRSIKGRRDIYCP